MRRIFVEDERLRINDRRVVGQDREESARARMPVAVISDEEGAGGSLLDGERTVPKSVGEREVIGEIIGARFGEGEADVIKVAPELDREIAASERGGQGGVANDHRGIGAP